jgi:hypothetical protein
MASAAASLQPPPPRVIPDERRSRKPPPPKLQSADLAGLLIVDAIFFALIYAFISAAKFLFGYVLASSSGTVVHISALSWSTILVSGALTLVLHWITANNREFLDAIQESKKHE